MSVTPNTLRSRLGFFTGFLSVVLLLLVVRIFFLQIMQHAFYRKLAEKNIIKIVQIPQNRGEFVDRNGVVIAGNTPDYDLKVYPYLMKDNAEVISLLSELALTSEEEIKQKMEDAKSPYGPVILQRHLSYQEVSQIVEWISDLPGVNVERRPLRDYRYGAIAAHVIGYTGEATELELQERTELKEGDVVGKSGLEKQYDEYLRGKPGYEFIEVDAKGREIGIFKGVPSVKPEPGSEIRLTIDIALQELADSLLQQYSGGSVVAMNPQNGSVLILYCKPGFDPNILVRGISFEGLQDLVYTQNSSFWNRATMSAYPPGSIFKIVVAALSLDNGVIEPKTRMRSCNGSFRIGNRIFNCWKRHGSLATYEAIVQSCDIFFYQVGMKLGFPAMAEGVKKLELIEKTGIDIPEESRGFFPNRAWYKERYDLNSPTKGMVANLSIGQGEVLLTPLQVCYFFSGIANNGQLVKPHLVNDIQHVSGEILYRSKFQRKKLFISKSTLDFIRKSMCGVVNERKGTGMLSRLSSILVAGKTGTAENPQGDDHAWFVGFAPFEKPEICIVVMVENGGHGGAVAAPIAGKILRRALVNQPKEQ
jgi:penicillin-binding protein 2